MVPTPNRLALIALLTSTTMAASASLAVAQDRALERVSVFAGLDGSKQPQDLGINANMGIRVSGNVGVPVSKALKLGAQLGAGVNVSDAAVHVLDQIEGTSRRTQTFVTVGLFQQPTARLTWALAYDTLFQQYYDDFTLGQARGFGEYQAGSSDAVGLWFTKGVSGDDGVMGTTPVRLDAVSQVNGYLTHTWPTQAAALHRRNQSPTTPASP